MSDEHTMWSKTLLDGFLSGMQGKPSDAWIKEQAKELAERGMSVDYLSKVIRKDIGEVQADRFLNVMGGSPKARAAPKKQQKKGFFGKLFS